MPNAWKMTLPVLFRELAQLAARRSTYITRTLAALAFYAIAIAMSRTFLEMQNAFGVGVRGAMGSGASLLIFVYGIVTLGLRFVLPAMVVGTIVSERENGTLDLMRITRLKAGEIVNQKLLARLVPVFCLLLLTAPFLAVAYSMGGVSPKSLGLLLLAWLLLALKLAAIAIMCSAIAHTAAGAFFMTYGIVLGLVMTTWLIQVLGMFISPALLGLLRYTTSGFIYMQLIPSSMGGTSSSAWWPLALNTLLQLGLIALFLDIARRRLVKPPSQRRTSAKQATRRIDRLLNRANRHVGNVHWGRRSSSLLPETQPVAWRERAAAAVCTPGHIGRLLLLVNAPVLLILILIAGFSSAHTVAEHSGLTVMTFVIWVPIVLILGIYISGLIPKERINQTLDVLLTTPLTRRQIVRQKLAATPRLCLVLAAPLVLTLLFEAGMEFNHGRSEPLLILGYLAVSLSLIALYLYAVIWITFGGSVKPRPRAQVAASAIGRLFGFIVVPLILAAVGQLEEEGFLLLSPVMVLGMLEADKVAFFDHAGFAAGGGLLTLLVAFFYRSRALRWASQDKQEGRTR